MATVNRQCRLSRRPVGMPEPDVWEFTEEPVGEPGDGEFLVQVLHISLDPAMRGWMNEGRSYVPPVGLGEVMRAGAIGRVIASRHPKYSEGDHVSGIFGVQEYAISNGQGAYPVDLSLAPPPVHLGTLGMPGFTAYFGLLDVGRAKEGDTVVVSAAAGAVGTVVGQIGRIKGCRVVGIAGGPEKCAYIVDELGFDAAIDYKSQDVRQALRDTCPDRIDVYFDNVGGDILDAALTRLNRGARIVICGAVSQYNNTGPMKGPSNYMALLVDRASMTGFVVFDFVRRYPEAAQAMGEWLRDGRLKSREDVVRGLENFPDALLKLFTGENTGKLVLEVAPA